MLRYNGAFKLKKKCSCHFIKMMYTFGACFCSLLFNMAIPTKITSKDYGACFWVLYFIELDILDISKHLCVENNYSKRNQLSLHMYVVYLKNSFFHSSQKRMLPYRLRLSFGTARHPYSGNDVNNHRNTLLGILLKTKTKSLLRLFDTAYICKTWWQT